MFLKGFPDVSAQAENFRIFFQGEPALIDGTSCATPAFAGFVALLNDARLARGQPSLGFLNPFLYSVGLAGLNDITVGNNPGCGTPGFNVSIFLPVNSFDKFTNRFIRPRGDGILVSVSM